jgi:hypothetical protein
MLPFIIDDDDRGLVACGAFSYLLPSTVRALPVLYLLISPALAPIS